MPPRKPWTPQPGTYPTDTATCPNPACRQIVRVLPAQKVLVTHKTGGDVATGSGPICSGSGKVAR